MLRGTAGLNRLREVGCSTEKRQQLGGLQPDKLRECTTINARRSNSIFTPNKIPAQIYVH